MIEHPLVTPHIERIEGDSSSHRGQCNIQSTGSASSLLSLWCAGTEDGVRGLAKALVIKLFLEAINL